MKKNIVGIQQLGIGVGNVKEAFAWYRRNLGPDIPVFEEAAEAKLMLPYTGGVSQKRHAILAINMKGGGGFEIWQYTGRQPQAPDFDVQIGDHGIFAGRIKTENVKASYDNLKSKGVNVLSFIVKNPVGEEHFFIQDPYGNIFDIVQGEDWFGEGKQLTGGVAGAIIGVSDIHKAKKLYSDILGFNKEVYHAEGVFEDLKNIPGGNLKVTRTLLAQKEPRKGAFSKLLGSARIELVQVKERAPKKIYSNRFWGDLGFIHLCFDVTGMDELKKECEKKGFPFTVDTADSFDMGSAAGRFSYIEDPDGTLIEFVETHKIPILKKLGWYLNLKKRDPEQALPDWMLKAMALNRVKN